MRRKRGEKKMNLPVRRDKEGGLFDVGEDFVSTGKGAGKERKKNDL